MTNLNEMRQYIDATTKFNESLDEDPVGWAANKLAKAGGRIASKFTGGATKQRIKQNVNVRSGAEDLIKIWNAGFGGRGMQRTPANIIRFLAKDKDMKMSKDQLKMAWNKTPQLTKNFGTFDEVANQLKKQPDQSEQPGEQPGQRRQPPQAPRTGITASPEDQAGGPRESIEEARVPATQQMSTDSLRNLFINAIHVKNASDAEKELGGFPGDEDEKQAAKIDPRAPDEQQPMDPATAGEPEPKMTPQKVDIMKKAGAKDMDNDGDYDYDDIAKTAVAQGKGEEALSSIMKAISPETAALVKAVLQGKIR